MTKLILVSALLLLTAQSGNPTSQKQGSAIEDVKQPDSKRTLHWKERALRVAYADVAMDRAFGKSVQYWQLGWILQTGWSHLIEHDLTDPIEDTTATKILIEGDCLANIHAAGDAIIHIQGNLKAEVRCEGLTELIIGGDIDQAGSIVLTEPASLFVGGDVQGKIESASHVHCWIDGQVAGSLVVNGSAYVHIVHDVAGTFRVEKDGNIELIVDGYMESEKLRSIANSGAWMDAAIASSDCEPWLYPEPADPNALETKFRCFWAVQHRKGR